MRRGGRDQGHGAAAHAFPSDGATDYLPINMSISEDTPPGRFIIVENWHEELKRLVPVD